jgi:hypothetical protein
MRQAVENIMIGAGTLNPDVRLTKRKAHRSRANVTVNADLDEEQDPLTEGGSVQITRSLSPPHTYFPRARSRTAI